MTDLELPALQTLCEPEPWMAAANCLGVDADLFFPKRGENGTHAKAVCAGCVVRSECLGYALETRQKHGIWGGLTEYDRRILRRRAS